MESWREELGHEFLCMSESTSVAQTNTGFSLPFYQELGQPGWVRREGICCPIQESILITIPYTPCQALLPPNNSLACPKGL